MIPDEIVDRVRDEADIVEIIGEFVKLKRVGTSFRGPCPFHHGKHDNFSVLPRGTFNCFVCGEKGNVFTFLQKFHGFDFVEAVKWVGARVGVEVREVSRQQEGPDPRVPLWAVNAAASEFFRRQLWEEAGGVSARSYVEGRGITQEDAERFTLGFAPRDGAPLHDHLRSLGYDDEQLLAAGLLVRREGSDDLRVRFRQRLMFPIFDLREHVVGFGGRVLGDGEPKYLNSSESEVFAKRRLLYGLNWAKQSIRRADRLLLVEGYFDLIRLVLAGIDEVVAPLGTALTEAQASLIRKYTKNVFLLYDSDTPGQKATFRAGDELLRNGISVRVVTLPDGEDPDSFVASQGAEGLEREIALSIDIFDRKIQILERGGWFSDLRRKRQALDKLLPSIRATSDRIMRDLYVERTSEVAGVSRELLLKEVVGDHQLSAERRSRLEAASGGAETTNAGAVHTRSRDRRRNYLSEGVRSERELIRLLLHRRELIEQVAERIDFDWFRDSVYRKIFVDLVSVGVSGTLGELAATFNEDAMEELNTLLNEPGGLDFPDETIAGCIARMKQRNDAMRMAELDRLIPLATEEQKSDLIAEKTVIHQRMGNVPQKRWKQFPFPSK